MNKEQILSLVSIACYMGVMLYIGIAASKKNKNADDFFLGGRKLGPFVTAMSAEASDMSSWLLMGLPSVALMGGLGEASFTAIGLAIGTYLNWLIIAKRLRIYSHKLNAYTIPDFFSKRFNDKRNIVKVIAALFIIIFFIPYTASGFSACGKLFSSFFHMDYVLATVISAIVILLYCTFGGFLAASTTDLVQSIIMTLALFVIVGFSKNMAGSWTSVFENMEVASGFGSISEMFTKSSSTNAISLLSTLSWGLGYFGMPHILLRFMAIEDEKKLKTSRRIGTSWVIISMTVAIFIGILGCTLRMKGVLPHYESASSAETVVVDISRILSNYGIFPALIAGLILSGILASTMSTADSQLLAAASAVSQNILVETMGLKLSKKGNMIAARISVIVISFIGLLLALNPDNSIFAIVSFAWAGFGAVFGPVVLVALFWKRTTLSGVIAGMISGGATVFLWKFIINKHFRGTFLDVYELLPAFLVALLFIVVVSLLSKKPGDDVTTLFDSVKKAKNS